MLITKISNFNARFRCYQLFLQLKDFPLEHTIHPKLNFRINEFAVGKTESVLALLKPKLDRGELFCGVFRTTREVIRDDRNISIDISWKNRLRVGEYQLQFSGREDRTMKVLLAIDGSKFSNAAAEQCCDLLSTVRDAEIHVLTVIEPAVATAGSLGVFTDYVGEVDEVIRSAAERVASDANRRILERMPSIGGGLTSRIAVGDPGDVITDEATRCGADLIVVGCSGSGFFRGARLGSVSNAIVHHAPCSVLVVRPTRYRRDENLLRKEEFPSAYKPENALPN